MTPPKAEQSSKKRIINKRKLFHNDVRQLFCIIKTGRRVADPYDVAVVFIVGTALAAVRFEKFSYFIRIIFDILFYFKKRTVNKMKQFLFDG